MIDSVVITTVGIIPSIVRIFAGVGLPYKRTSIPLINLPPSLLIICFCCEGILFLMRFRGPPKRAIFADRISELLRNYCPLKSLLFFTERLVGRGQCLYLANKGLFLFCGRETAFWDMEMCVSAILGEGERTLVCFNRFHVILSKEQYDYYGCHYFICFYHPITPYLSECSSIAVYVFLQVQIYSVLPSLSLTNCTEMVKKIESEDSEAPLKPYFMFRAEVYDGVREQHPDKRVMEVVAIIDGMWAICDQATKDRLHDQYHRSRLTYQEVNERKEKKAERDTTPPQEQQEAGEDGEQQYMQDENDEQYCRPIKKPKGRKVTKEGSPSKPIRAKRGGRR